MADRNPPDSKVKALLAAIMGRKSPQPDPEKSYFAQPEPDRDAERKHTRRQTVTTSNKPIAGIDHPDPARAHRLDQHVGKAQQPFEKVSESAKIKEQQQFESRFKTDAAREAALTAMEDAAVLRQAATDKYLKLRDDIDRKIDRHPAGKVWSEEWGLSINQQGNKAREDLNRELAEIKDTLDGSLGQIALRDAQVNIGPKPEPRRLEYKTLAIEGPEVVDADVVEDDAFEHEPATPWIAYPDGAIVSVNDDHDFVEQFNEVAKHLPPDDPGGFKPKR